MESSWRGISIRALLALITVGTGLTFLYTMAFIAILAVEGEVAVQIALSIVVAVISFINLALGFYLGQKNVGQSDSETNITTAEDVTVNPATRETRT